MAKGKNTPQDTICPSCNATWTKKEVKTQSCDTCGYPLVSDFSDSAFDDEEDEFGYDDEL
jgi:predicted amidophosphoribosyltransferase